MPIDFQTFIHPHQEFRSYTDTLSDSEFFEGSEKWNAAEVYAHMILSIRPVYLACRLPSPILQLFFGRANRPSRTSEEVIEKYQKVLAAGGVSSAKFLPPSRHGLDKRQKYEAVFQKLTTQMAQKTARISEDKLDHCILPHPLLGKLTLREMIYFSIHHMQHHLEHLQAQKKI